MKCSLYRYSKIWVTYILMSELMELFQIEIKPPWQDTEIDRYLLNMLVPGLITF